MLKEVYTVALTLDQLNMLITVSFDAIERYRAMCEAEKASHHSTKWLENRIAILTDAKHLMTNAECTLIDDDNF